MADKLIIDGIEVDASQLKLERVRPNDSIANALANLHDFLKGFQLSDKEREFVIVHLLDIAIQVSNSNHLWSLIVSEVIERRKKNES